MEKNIIKKRLLENEEMYKNTLIDYETYKIIKTNLTLKLKDIKANKC